MSYKQLYNQYNFKELEKRYNIFFEDKELIVRAFTHTSFVCNVDKNYERLEFLGDSVLQMVVTDYLYRNLHLREGEMSKYRSKLVNEVSLTKIMEEEGLTKYIIVGDSVKGLTHEKAAYVADMYESMVASIYLDQGYEVASEFIKKTLLSREKELITNEDNQDYKTNLQEILQKNGTIKIEYKTKQVDEGLFRSVVCVDDIQIGKGEGSSKKNAEQKAAREAMKLYV